MSVIINTNFKYYLCGLTIKTISDRHNSGGAHVSAFKICLTYAIINYN